MKILVINAGSSSLKYQIMDMENENVLAKGLCERIGIDGKITHKSEKGEYSENIPMKNHGDAIKAVISAITNKDYGCVSSLDEISAIGHRVLHAAEKYTASVLVDNSVIEAIEECIPLGPLHNPANLIGIKACMEAMPTKPNVAVFDTAFHQTMPKKAYMYGLPYEYYEKHRIRKYGFHGTSHRFVTLRASQVLDKPLNELNIITCHLGNGSSMAAIRGGKCVDTTMGLTPLEGPMMGTRCGIIDPAAVSFICDKEKISVEEVDTVMNKKSGMLGISGVSSDFRDITKAANEGNDRAALALDMFQYQIKKFIGSYLAVVPDVEAIIFTAGIGENDGPMRKRIISGLEHLGIELDDKLNEIRGKEQLISTDNSKIKVYVIPTNEELMIARDTKEIVEAL